MDFEKFLSLEVGEKVGFLKSDLEGMRPIIELTETVRPRAIIVVRDDEGGDCMIALSYNTESKTAWVQFRHRDREGAKFVPPRIRLQGTKDEKELDEAAALLKEGAEEAAKKVGWNKPNVVDIPVKATPEELVKILGESGEFDIVAFDEKTHTASKEA